MGEWGKAQAQLTKNPDILGLLFFFGPKLNQQLFFLFLISQPNHVVGTQKNHLNEMVLWSTQMSVKTDG